MRKKIQISNESMRISDRNAGSSAALNRFNFSDSGNSNHARKAPLFGMPKMLRIFVHNDNFANTKIKIILAAFVIFEILDAALTFAGISQRGLGFEKNIFAKNLIASFGFLPVAAIKVFASAAFAFLINYLYSRLERYGKYLFYLSVLLMLMAFYGVGSGVYVLVFYP